MGRLNWSKTGAVHILVHTPGLLCTYQSRQNIICCSMFDRKVTYIEVLYLDKLIAKDTDRRKRKVLYLKNFLPNGFLPIESKW